VQVIGSVEPCLASFVQEPADALKSIELLIVDAANHIADRADQISGPVPLMIRATDRMRTVPREEQRILYAQMYADYTAQIAPTLRTTFNLTLATLTNQEQAFLGFVATNFSVGGPEEWPLGLFLGVVPSDDLRQADEEEVIIWEILHLVGLGVLVTALVLAVAMTVMFYRPSTCLPSMDTYDTCQTGENDWSYL